MGFRAETLLEDHISLVSIHNSSCQEHNCEVFLPLSVKTTRMIIFWLITIQNAAILKARMLKMIIHSSQCIAEHFLILKLTNKGAVNHNGKKAVSRTESKTEIQLPQKASCQSFQGKMVCSQILIFNQSTHIFECSLFTWLYAECRVKVKVSIHKGMTIQLGRKDY